MSKIDEYDIPDPTKPPRQPKVELAVFDFDGTCIKGKSPVLLTVYLAHRKMLRLTDVFLVACWGVAYKLHLPISESWVRGMVFRAFEGKPAAEADELLRTFYDEKIAHRFRPNLARLIVEHKAQGRVVMAVSATFEPIILRMLESHPFDFEISTRMIVDANGNYTRKVEGLPIEGAEKVAAIRRFANERYGEGNWEIDYAYSDHYSDKPLLFAARHAVAVDPDSHLTRTAKREGWEMIE